MAKSTTETKVIYGVPVLPGLQPSPFTIEVTRSESSASDRNSRGSDKLDTSTSVVEKPEPPAVPQKPTRSPWTLRHVDFMPPHEDEKKSEKFKVLMGKANHWLKEHAYVVFCSIETMTWTTIDKPVYTDSGLQQKSMSADRKTKMVRGIRLWYFVLDDTFYEIKAPPELPVLGYENFIPDGKNDNMGNILKRFNFQMSVKPVPGKILRVETLHIPTDSADADVSYWREQPEKQRQYYSFLRVYYAQIPNEVHKYQEICIKDFIPYIDQRTPHNQGFEVYGDIWKRCARWLFLNPKFQCLSLQSLFVKYKKDVNEGELWERCYHQEHGSAHSSLSNGKTEYIQIVRLAYASRPSKPDKVEPERKKMFYTTFSPSRLLKPSGASEEDLSELNYQDLRQAEEPLNAWITCSGARVYSVETVPTRLKSGGQETLGGEATFVYNSREKCPTREMWINNIRLYLEGEFLQAPVTWPQQSLQQTQIMAKQQQT